PTPRWPLCWQGWCWCTWQRPSSTTGLITTACCSACCPAAADFRHPHNPMNLKKLRSIPNLAFASALLWASVPAQAQQQLVPAQSSIELSACQMGVPLQGHFKKFDAQLAFDPAKLASSRIRFTVDTGSATMGARETDAELPKPVWFNVAQFPQAVF